MRDPHATAPRRRFRLPLRGMIVGSAIAIGLLASIATSRTSDAITRETTRFYPQATDLSGETSEVVRLCPVGWFTDPGDPVTYELTVRGEGLQTASVPVILSVHGYRETARLNLQWPNETHHLELSVIRDPETDSSDCSPWARVTIGPLAGEPGTGVVQWRLAITAELFPSGRGKGNEGWGDLEFGSAR